MLRTTGLILFTTCWLFTSVAMADDQGPAVEVVGKRLRLVTNSNTRYEGVVEQATDKAIVLMDVFVIGIADTGIPFLSNVPHQNRLFKNVGLSVRNLEHGVAIAVADIKSWQVVDGEASTKVQVADPLGQVQVDRLNQATWSHQIAVRLSQSEKLSDADREKLVEQLDRLRESLLKR